MHNPIPTLEGIMPLDPFETHDRRVPYPITNWTRWMVSRMGSKEDTSDLSLDLWLL